MSRLIDAEELKKCICENSYLLRDEINSTDRGMFTNGIVQCIDEQPTIILAQRKGVWLKSYADHESFGTRPFFRYCSACNEASVYQYKWCPNCGADMRGAEDADIH